MDLAACRSRRTSEMLLLKGYAAAGDAGLLFQLHLTLQVAAPHGFDKAGFLVGQLDHLLHAGGGVGAVLPVLQGPLVEAVVDGFQKLGDFLLQLIQGTMVFPVVPADQDTMVVFDVLGADLQPQGTPFISYWANFQPGLLSLASHLTRQMAERRLRSSSALSKTPSCAGRWGR